MKVLWLNEALTEAVLVRGRWWWKRGALVRLVTIKVTTPYASDRTVWKFVASDLECSTEIANRLHTEQHKETERRNIERDWQPFALLYVEDDAPKALPEARTAQR